MKMLRERVIALALQQIHGEKKGAARMRGTSIIRDASIAVSYVRRNALRLLRTIRANFVAVFEPFQCNHRKKCDF